VIRIICVGRLKERHYAEAAGEYQKRLGRYAKVEVRELRERTDRNPEVALRKEADAILAAMRDDTYTLVLDRDGRRLSSEGLAGLLRKPDVTFVIGGPEGLSEDVKRRADFTLSLSDMTFPHQLARVMLLEQVYRGCTINAGEKYHR